MKINNNFILFIVGILVSMQFFAQETSSSPWPELTNTNQPWARWWWMGSAVDKENLQKNLIDFQKSGIGGVEITPIYGVKGEEANFKEYLSPKWMEMLEYTIHVADSLGLQVDMVLGTGWPYGGPQVTLPYAASKLSIKKYTVRKNETFYKDITISKAKEKGSLLNVVAYGADGSYLNLTNKLKDNILHWKPKKTDYTLYAIFIGKTGQQVKRAAPGGKGYTLDHYSQEALNVYVKPFDKALKGFEGKLRSVFNDSYEVYGTDFTPLFIEEFRKRRGYDIKKHLPKLLSKVDFEEGNRLKSDYRETLSDLLLEKFNEPWTKWAHNKNFKTRLQAHGSPGNLIDLYASADIPECETFGSMPFNIPGLRREQQDIREGDADPVMLKFSSSAAHISGKPLTSSETFTWLRDHFKTALSQCKPEVEDLLLNGINHVILHGSTYSAKRADWPGWKFYASVNFNSNNTIWEDAPSLFSYITNCQSMLQQGKSDNETLLYWPVHDIWNKYHNGSLFFQFKIHSLQEWLQETPFYDTTKRLMEKGYGVDFISDNFIKSAQVKNGLIVLPGGTFKTLIVPPCERMPLKTLEKLISLKKEGATIIFEDFPSSVPGFFNYKKQTEKLQTTLKKNRKDIQPALDIFQALNMAGVTPEELVGTGLKYIRRDLDGEKIYYLVNHTSKTIDEFIPLQIGNKEVVILNPLTEVYGNAKVQKKANVTLVKIRLEPGQSLLLKTENVRSQKQWVYYNQTNPKINLEGVWNVSFDKGGPQLPENTKFTTLKSWTTCGAEAERFSGTATYSLEFEAPELKASNWSLNLGDVRESAKVFLNKAYIGTVWSVPFKINLGKLKKGKNTLKVEVTNLGANRVRAIELDEIEWKNFYEINMVDKDYKKFDATKWDPIPSGLLGPVSITPLYQENNQ